MRIRYSVIPKSNFSLIMFYISLKNDVNIITNLSISYIYDTIVCLCVVRQFQNLKLFLLIAIFNCDSNSVVFGVIVEGHINNEISTNINTVLTVK